MWKQYQEVTACNQETKPLKPPHVTISTKAIHVIFIIILAGHGLLCNTVRITAIPITRTWTTINLNTLNPYSILKLHNPFNSFSTFGGWRFNSSLNALWQWSVKKHLTPCHWPLVVVGCRCAGKTSYMDAKASRAMVHSYDLIGTYEHARFFCTVSGYRSLNLHVAHKINNTISVFSCSHSVVFTTDCRGPNNNFL